jgi:hypothetical protein
METTIFIKKTKLAKQLFWKTKGWQFLKIALPTLNTHKLANNITSTKTTKKSYHPTNWTIRERERERERDLWILSWSLVHEHCHVLLCYHECRKLCDEKGVLVTWHIPLKREKFIRVLYFYGPFHIRVGYWYWVLPYQPVPGIGPKLDFCLVLWWMYKLWYWDHQYSLCINKISTTFFNMI